MTQLVKLTRNSTKQPVWINPLRVSYFAARGQGLTLIRFGEGTGGSITVTETADMVAEIINDNID